jgi:hypothetical protein
MKRVDVLEDVGLAVGDENHVELVERLINEAHIILLNSRMLSSSICQLWESCKQGFHS